MAFPPYTPTPTKLVTLARADGSELLSAATTNVSLEQLADAIAYIHGRAYVESAVWTGDPGFSNVSEAPSAYGFPNATYLPNGTDANALKVTLPSVLSGDIIHIDVSMHVVMPASVFGYLRVGITHGAGTEYTAAGLCTAAGGASGQSFDVSLLTRVAASASGSTVVRVLGRNTGGVGNFNVMGNSTLRATVLRAM